MNQTSAPVVPPTEATPGGETPAGSFVRAVLVQGSRQWRVSQAKVAVLLLAPLGIAASGVVTAAIGKGVYRMFVGEDRVAESLQAASYFLALVLAALLAQGLWSAGRKRFGLVYGLFALALVFQVGEELSWGQRIVGWETPEAFSELNKQAETNLHNVHGVGSAFKWVQLVVAAYGGLVPLVLLRSRLPDRLRLGAGLLVPPVTLVLYFLPLFVWRIYRNVAEAPARFSFVVEEYNEVMELCFALGVLLFCVFQVRRTASRDWADSLGEGPARGLSGPG